ncbi:MAG TPA: hypothetical protein VNH64_00900 [Parvularculaceae bacterium]|nr:hypothetical protein [Parvularculaceae bacterium]
MNKLFSAVAGAILAGAPVAASAQNTQLSQSNPVIDSVSVSDMISVLNAIDFEAKMVEEAPNGAKIIEASSNGVTLYFALRECKGSGAEAPCVLVQPYIIFQGSGVTLEQINDFNLNHSAKSTAGLAPNGNVIVATKIFVNQGVTAAHFIFETALYFADIDNYVKAVKPGVIASVSYKPSVSGTAAFEGIAGTSADLRVNTAGPDAPSPLNDTVRAVIEGGAKIKN